MKIKITALNLEFDIILPQSVPTSEISNAFNENEIEESFIQCSYRLYSKYIDSSQAMMEVNISSQLRTKLINVFRDRQALKLKDILPLMEAAAKEISHLMNDSYSRFRRESVFTELKYINSQTRS
mmetsp:Transcript_20643/g.18223  ORF Transcript_20643/g.18223 Transcript_20643/m.18223 type:complete len:125 (+) Transcript_20643:2-376(+)